MSTDLYWRSALLHPSLRRQTPSCPSARVSGEEATPAIAFKNRCGTTCTTRGPAGSMRCQCAPAHRPAAFATACPSVQYSCCARLKSTARPCTTARSTICLNRRSAARFKFEEFHEYVKWPAGSEPLSMRHPRCSGHQLQKGPGTEAQVYSCTRSLSGAVRGSGSSCLHTRFGACLPAVP
jgi:hypothetical protein